MIRRPPRSTLSSSSAASDVYKRQVAGVDGNGQKELVEVILGIRKQSSGTIKLDGVDMSSLSVLKRKKLGIGYISDDRQQDGLVMDMNLTDNILLKTHTDKRFIKRGLINDLSLIHISEPTRLGMI